MSGRHVLLSCITALSLISGWVTVLAQVDTYMSDWLPFLVWICASSASMILSAVTPFFVSGVMS